MQWVATMVEPKDCLRAAPMAASKAEPMVAQKVLMWVE